MTASKQYKMRIRPVSTFTLPQGITYELISRPWGNWARRDLKASEYRYGTFTTNRPLTPEEMELFSIEEVIQTKEEMT